MDFLLAMRRDMWNIQGFDENGNPWAPRNANTKRYGEMVTLKWGLANSDNWITARLMSKLNPYALKRLIDIVSACAIVKLYLLVSLMPWSLRDFGRRNGKCIYGIPQ